MRLEKSKRSRMRYTYLEIKYLFRNKNEIRQLALRPNTLGQARVKPNTKFGAIDACSMVFSFYIKKSPPCHAKVVKSFTAV